MAEKEYIERGKIENWLLTESASLDTEVDREYVVERLRAEIPTADVRPVVLCRDCKHNKGAEVWRFLDLEDTTADCSAGHGYPPMDWFCADGEKRQEAPDA